MVSPGLRWIIIHESPFQHAVLMQVFVLDKQDTFDRRWAGGVLISLDRSVSPMLMKSRRNSFCDSDVAITLDCRCGGVMPTRTVHVTVSIPGLRGVSWPEYGINTDRPCDNPRKT